MTTDTTVKDASSIASADGLTRSGLARVSGIDTLRGLVIVLMVLDHVRDFFSVPIDPLALDSGDPAPFLTRWVTHLCAPTFVFLAGVSVWLQASNGKTKSELSRFLVTRGLWLIVLEIAVIGMGFNFGWWIFLQVIWAIGAGMLVLAGLIWLPRWTVLGIGAAILVLHPLLTIVPVEALGPLEVLWRPLAVFGPWQTSAGFALVAYPAIPWMGVLLLGYGLGFIFGRDPAVRTKWVLGLAIGALTSFAVLRGFNLSGVDPRPWAIQAEPLWTAFSVINVSKYPPSLAYVLVTLGLALLLYLGLERLKGPVASVLTTFGRTPLFTYLIHVWLAHGLAVAVGLAIGIPLDAFGNSILDPERLTKAGWGFGLAGVYLAWLTTLVLLYPLSRWFEGIKRRRRDWWLSYL